jgi:hypothetical protein
MEFIIKSPKFGTHVALVDDQDYEVVKKYNWTLDKRDNGKNYARASIKSGVNNFTYIYLHRLIMGFPEGMQVDHKDNNGLNNCRQNLRTTPIVGSKNQFNMGKPKSNTSGYKGVHYLNQFGKYESSITVERKNIFLGYYDTALKAAYVYNHYSALYHGEFGCPNKFTLEEREKINRFIQDGFIIKPIRRLKQRGYRGVSKAMKPPIGRPFTTNVMVNKIKYNLGYFSTEIEAAKAYNEGLVKYGGDLRKLNKIPE